MSQAKHRSPPTRKAATFNGNVAACPLETEGAVGRSGLQKVSERWRRSDVGTNALSGLRGL